MIFEVCCDSCASVAAAVAGKANRIELCDGLIDGGVTPSVGKIKDAVRQCNAAEPAIPVFVLIRPRAGDFVYSLEEKSVMLDDIRHCVTLGVQGVVSGALDEAGKVDAPFLQDMVRICNEGCSVNFTFHRAIDVCADWRRAMDICAKLGIGRILSSGQACTALTGASTLASMVEYGSSRGLCIVAAGGVTADTVGEVVHRTGVREVHGSVRCAIPSASQYRPDPVVYMGREKFNSPAAEFVLRQATPDSVAAVVSVLRSLTGK